MRPSTSFGEPLEVAAVTVAAIVLLLLPLVEVGADPIAGFVGAVVGLAMGGSRLAAVGGSGRG